MDIGIQVTMTLFWIGYVWYDKPKPAGKDKQQIWIVEKDNPTDLTFHFKSVYWGRKFLSAEEGKWVYHHYKYKSTKWQLTVNTTVDWYDKQLP